MWAVKKKLRNGGQSRGKWNLCVLKSIDLLKVRVTT